VRRYLRYSSTKRYHFPRFLNNHCTANMAPNEYCMNSCVTVGAVPPPVHCRRSWRHACANVSPAWVLEQFVLLIQCISRPTVTSYTTKRWRRIHCSCSRHNLWHNCLVSHLSTSRMMARVQHLLLLPTQYLCKQYCTVPTVMPVDSHATINT
jgi:hypothetical protein